MNWFKHSVTASLELPVSQILAQYGYYGVGVFWTIMERVCMSEGQFTVADLQRQFANKGFGANKVKEIILGFGAFKLDAHARVSPAESDENPQSDCGTIAKRSQKVPPSNARTYNNKTRKDKEKEEDKEINKEINKEGEIIRSITTTNIYEYLEQSFGRTISSIEIEKLDSWVKEFNEEIVQHAIDCSVLNNVKKFSYVEATLRNWKAQQYKTIEEIKENEDRFYNRGNIEIDKSMMLFDYNWLEDTDE